MKKIIRFFFYNLFTLYVVSSLVDGIRFEGGLVTFIYAAGALTLAMLLVKPIINLFLLPINLITFGGQHDDGDVRLGAKRPAERKTILARQHEIEEDEVDPAVGHYLLHGPAIFRLSENFRTLGLAGLQVALQSGDFLGGRLGAAGEQQHQA